MGIRFMNFLGFLSGVAEVSVLLGCDRASYSMAKMKRRNKMELCLIHKIYRESHY
jgi:hypothetical protein